MIIFTLKEWYSKSDQFSLNHQSLGKANSDAQAQAQKDSLYQPVREIAIAYFAGTYLVNVETNVHNYLSAKIGVPASTVIFMPRSKRGKK